MLVKELIAELQKLDPDAPVYGWNSEFSAPVLMHRILKQPSFRDYFGDSFTVTYKEGYVIR